MHLRVKLFESISFYLHNAVLCMSLFHKLNTEFGMEIVHSTIIGFFFSLTDKTAGLCHFGFEVVAVHHKNKRHGDFLPSFECFSGFAERRRGGHVIWHFSPFVCIFSRR